MVTLLQIMGCVFQLRTCIQTLGMLLEKHIFLKGPFKPKCRNYARRIISGRKRYFQDDWFTNNPRMLTIVFIFISLNSQDLKT
jgi:hypothetical protein